MLRIFIIVVVISCRNDWFCCSYYIIKFISDFMDDIIFYWILCGSKIKKLWYSIFWFFFLVMLYCCLRIGVNWIIWILCFWVVVLVICMNWNVFLVVIFVYVFYFFVRWLMFIVRDGIRYLLVIVFYFVFFEKFIK